MFCSCFLNNNSRKIQVISIMRSIINKFHKSHIGTAELNQARKETGTKNHHGLEAISKTRFGTVIRAARSLNRCLPAIKKVVERGVFDLGVSNSFISLNSYQSTLGFGKVLPIKNELHKFPVRNHSWPAHRHWLARIESADVFGS